MNNPHIKRAVKLAMISLGAAATALPASVALAQSDDLEEVIVTGSRIKRADLDSASPVTVLNLDEIKLTGITDVGDLLQRLPSMSGSPIGTTTNNGGNGSVLIDLRGLGTIRTLTLVNGKRVVDGGDYQTIPASMIDRVEILKDGASAVYGADAVAGVVNIITRKDFEGVEIDALHADFFDMDSGQNQSIGVVAGKSFDGGNFVMGAEYVNQEEAFQRDAPWDFFQDSYFIYPGGCEAQVTAPYDGTGNPATSGCYIVGSSRIPEGRLRFGSNGTFMNTDGSGLTPFDGRTYNYAPVNYIQTPFERTNIFAEGNMDITSSIRLRGELRANQRTSSQFLAPQPYNSPTDPSFQGGISADNFYLTQAVTAYNLANPGSPIPVGQPVTDARRRMVEIDRTFEQDINQVQGALTLEGDLANGMSWDVFFNKGQRNRADQDFGQFYGPSLTNALGPSAMVGGQLVCLSDINDPTSIIAGCVPFNMFGGPGSVTQAMLDYVGVNLSDSYTSKQMQYGGSITGSAFKLPGGELGWAAGYEYRWEDFVYAPDSAKQQGQVTGNKGSGTKGGYHSKSFFGEVLAPLYNNGTQSLDLTVGLRRDDFSTFGNDTTFQAGLEFQALESLKLRATFGEVFRAPGIGELFAGVGDSFPTFNDPCDASNNDPVGVLAPGCNGMSTTQLDTQVLSRVGGNTGLGAETGDTVTAGLVWTPEFGNGDLSLTLDYWKTELDDVITTLGVGAILQDCYFDGNVNGGCALITRRTSDFTIASIVDTLQNVASATAEGIDVEARYGFDSSFGRWDTSFLWAHMLDRSQTAVSGGPVEQLEGFYSQNGSAYAEDKINYTIGWSQDNLRVSLLGEYISELDAPVSFISTYRQKIDSQLYHDLVTSYTFDQTNTNVTMGITNITDEAPPYIDFGFNASTDPSTYRLFGRGYYLRLNQSF